MKAVFNHFLFPLLLFIFLGCNEMKNNDEKYYTAEFIKKVNKFDSLSNYLIVKYGSRSTVNNESQTILINPSFIRRSTPAQKIDSSILKWMNEIYISEINMVSEDSICARGSRYDKIFFEAAKNSYYPIVTYIYSRCPTDSINYKSETIRRISLNSRWQLLIDSNYP